jgi:hypothetical protein
MPLLTAHPAVAQQLSDSALVSILTCGTGNEMYSLYGHTAIRVYDPVNRWDYVFNYGVFDFSKPHFAFRFAKGLTDYKLDMEPFRKFMAIYQYNRRSVKEQVLALRSDEKQRIWTFLLENYKPENRIYRYNFFKDNCATRVRDVITRQLPVSFDGAGEELTYRQHSSRYQHILPWLDFGIWLILGLPADEVADKSGEMFLPDYLMKHIATAEIRRTDGAVRLVASTRMLYEPEPEAEKAYPYWPFAAGWLLLAVTVGLTVLQLRRQTMNFLIDYALLSLTGTAGVIMLLMMLFSEHPAVKANYNVVWAVPLNIVFAMAWAIKKWRPAIRPYWICLGAVMAFYLLCCRLLPQSFHPVTFLIAASILCRCVAISWRYRKM